MEFKSDKAKFTIPDKITVRMQLEYIGAVTTVEQAQHLVRKWEGAKQLIESWECEILPKFEVNLDDITDPNQTDVIVWAGLQVWLHMNSLGETPKN